MEQLLEILSEVNPDIDFENCDVLFLYSSLVLNNSDTLK